jgi:hypothetical protein
MAQKVISYDVTLTPLTYDATKAQSVFETAHPFLADAQALLAELRRRNDD